MIKSIATPFFVLALFISPLYGQIDSLKSLLPTVEGDAKIAIQFELIGNLMFDDPQLASEYAEDALELAYNTATDSLLTEAYHFMGLVNYFRSKWHVAIDYYTKALESEWGRTSKHYQVRATNNIAICYEKIGSFDKATEFYLKSLQGEEALGNELGAAQTRLNLSILYMNMAEPEKARELLLTILPVLNTWNDVRNLVGCYQNLALVERVLGHKTEAYSYLDSAEAILDELNYKLPKADLYHDFAYGCFQASDFQSALHYYRLAAAHRDTSIQKPGYYTDLMGQGGSLMALGEIEQAEELLLEVKANLNDPGHRESQFELANQLTHLYAYLGDRNAFDQAFSEYQQLNEEIAGQATRNTIEELKVIYDTAQKDAEIVHQDEIIRSQRSSLLLLAALVILIAGGLTFFIFLGQRLRSSYDELYRSNQELSQRWAHLQKFFSIDASNGFSGETLFSRIMTLMSDEKLYLQTDLSLDALAKRLNSNSKYISQSINRNASMNYSLFVNTFRVEEAKRLMAESDSGTWTLDAIAAASGFNNRTSFFHVFKKVTGLPPAVFKQRIKHS